MYRRRVVIRSRQARPLSELVVGDSGGRLCYVVAATPPGAIAVALEEDQVDDVIAALSAWRAERAADQHGLPRPFSAEQSPPAQAV